MPEAHPQAELWVVPKPSMVVVVGVELAPKVNQSYACWAPKANQKCKLWVVPRANQPGLVNEVERLELAPVLHSSGEGGGERLAPSSC